ncbi:MAG: type II toxin-antitoxin system death-on-curing family toxin [Candidatus Spechtbacteria bacterium]|nr:type II toxin-antitoxin system death-on-curing family toxin [Candidatus Spechtbacteria bacterium]
MKYLSPQDILVIHAQVINETGGLHGIREVGLLVSLSERPKIKLYGKILYADVFVKAAIYLESLVRYHVFADGNKRTAFVTSARFLHLNGFDMEVSNKVAEKFMRRVAMGKLTIETIAKWLKDNSLALKK